MFSSINTYCEWNRGLWRFFFPKKEENAILYIDETVLSQVAELYKIKIDHNVSITHQFLSSTLLTQSALLQFKFNWENRTGERNTHIASVKSWDKLVERLMPLKADGYPAYFAMLCAIMLLACIQGANHNRIKEKAQEYLGKDFTAYPGMLIDPLLQQLHKDNPHFNPDRMICGEQRHMSRLKYHLVLKKSMREDFIDFLEVNNLQWQYESYPFFVDNILIPALEKAEKNELIRIIIKEENIPYVKNILRGKLNYGKKVSDCGNTIQEKNAKWGYELYFDFDGSHTFSIFCDYLLPFNLTLRQGVFEISEEPSTSDYIAENVALLFLPPKELSFEGSKYKISNLSEGTKDNGSRFYFEHISDDIYRQVETPVTGKEYYVFIKKNAQLKSFEKKWEHLSDIQEQGYDVFSVQSYLAPKVERKDMVKVKDTFQLNELGSWFSVSLSDGQSIFWQPNQLGACLIPLTCLIRGGDNKSYFRLSPTRKQHLSGNIVIKEGNKEVLSEQISCDFEWDGKQTAYHMNGWGEPTNSPIDDKNVEKIVTGRQCIQNSLISQSRGSDILLQVLYDLADSYGCVSGRKMRAAIDFALPFFGIAITKKRRKSVIYALRRLGYIYSFYDIDRKDYVNQLVSKYIERSNYSISGVRNAFVVKGVYSHSELASLLKDIQTNFIHRKRPYGKSDRHEYACLPDVVLFEGPINEEWTILDFPIADYLISNMENMRNFASKFGINNGGDTFFGIPSSPAPCMIKYNKGNEILCIQDRNGRFVTKKYYDDGEKQKLIPTQLSRVFCQNSQNMPICMMEFSGVTKRTNYAKVSFVAGMGMPAVLEVALCDLSLGMPGLERVFIVDQNRALGIPTNEHDPTIEKMNYSTTATSTNFQYLLGAITKISGRGISDIETSDSVVFLYKVNGWYKMKYTRYYLGKCGLLSLFYGSDLLAFAIGDSVYYKDESSSNYYKLDGENLYALFSTIICARHTIISNKQKVYNKPLPVHPKGDLTIDISILERR